MMIPKALISVAGAALLQFVAVAQADAMTFSFYLKSLAKLNQPSFVSEGPLQVGPLGHAVLCTKAKISCSTDSTSASDSFLTDDKMPLLRMVNAAINKSIRARPDPRSEGFGDTWSIDVTRGDCEDYALSKMAALTKQGIPSTTMRIAVVKTRKGEPHAVLVVRTLHGDMVLDNLKQRIVSWQRTDYNWLMIQSSLNQKTWLKVNSPRTAAIAGTS